MENWRIFCGVKLPESLQETIQQHVEQLRRLAPHNRASWSRPANIHLTLKFFGDVPREKIKDISAAIQKLRSGSFQISIVGSGVFPRPDHARVLWIGIDDETGGLVKLHAALEESLATAGFKKEERSFHPHLTIARLRVPTNTRALVQRHLSLSFGPKTMIVEEVTLFRSELSSAGSKYTSISRHSLTENA